MTAQEVQEAATKALGDFLECEDNNKRYEILLFWTGFAIGATSRAEAAEAKLRESDHEC